MLTDEEETILHLASLRGTTTEMTFARDELKTAVASIIAARVRAARAQERQQVIDELRGFLPEWNYPPHVIAAISLELRDHANHIESSHNG